MATSTAPTPIPGTPTVGQPRNGYKDLAQIELDGACRYFMERAAAYETGRAASLVRHSPRRATINVTVPSLYTEEAESLLALRGETMDLFPDVSLDIWILES